MTAVILTVHSLIVLALIGVVLLQRSDGGALGIGGGGSGGGFMTGRGAANALTRTTSILAALFFATSLLLAIRAGGGETAEDALDALTGAEVAAPTETSPSGELSTEDLLNSLGAAEEAPATPETAEELLQEMGVDAPATEAETAETPAEDAAPAEETPNE